MIAPLVIWLVVRETTDWGDAEGVRAQLPAGFVPVVDLWDATFTLPYHLFRVELKRIAERSWSRVEGARVVPRGEVPTGAVVVPTDDDDWFAPTLAEAIRGGAGGAGWRWPSRFLEVPISLRHRLGRIRRRLFPATPSKWLCTTNNYAFAEGAVPDGLLDSHMAASRWFAAHADRIAVLEEPLSVMNRSLASRTTLSFGGRMTRARLLRRWRSYRRLYASPPPADLAWSAPYVEAMAELMERLRPR
jgi:hypothetical protein